MADHVFAVHRARGFWRTRAVTYLSNPVRRAFYDIPDWESPPAGAPFRLLIVGGSQGAQSLNNAVLECLPAWKGLPLEIVHQSGSLDLARVTKGYQDAGWGRALVCPFIDDMASAYAAAHLVICRAGALTVAEVSAAGRPALFVPLHIARGHQAFNVEHLLESKAARVYLQQPGLTENLAAAVGELIAEPAKMAQLGAKAREVGRAGGIRSAEQIAQTVAAFIRASE